MTLFSFLVGIILSAIVILYILDFFDKTKGKSVIKNKPITPENLQKAIKKTLKENRTKEKEKRLRICPICGTILSEKEYLIAAFEPLEHPQKKRKVQIYGCIYCFTTDGVNLKKDQLDPSDL
ncbi:MAG: hypothetical protein ACK4UJ_11015 [Leptonema sp. (in: bacteria)]